MNIKARLKRNNLIELAADSFRDEHSIIVQELRNSNKDALLGIQKDDHSYTIIGSKFVYYCTDPNNETEISHNLFLDILTKNALKLGKTGNFEFVMVDEEKQDSIWVKNGATMNAIWNTIIFLAR
jgi:hypothetical protein